MLTKSADSWPLQQHLDDDEVTANQSPAQVTQATDITATSQGPSHPAVLGLLSGENAEESAPCAGALRLALSGQDLADHL